MKRRSWLARVGVGGSLAMPLAWAGAQEPPATPARERERDALVRPTPSRTPVIEVGLADPGRVIAIERGLGGGPKAAIYFHRPLLALESRPPGAGPEGQPPIIHQYQVDRDGEVVATVRVVSSSPEFRIKARRELVASLHEQEARGVPSDHPIEAVQVQRYPLLHVLVSATSGGEALARGESAWLSEAGDTFVIPLRFASEAGYRSFIEAHREGRCSFDYRYLYDGVKAVQATSYVRADRTVRQQVRRVLESHQRSEGGPLFQPDFNEIQREVASSLKRLVVGDAEGLKLLGGGGAEGAFAALFDTRSYSFEEIEGPSEGALQAGVRSYLKALEQTAKVGGKTTEGRERTDSDRRKDSRSTSIKPSVKVGIPIGKAKLDLGLNVESSEAHEEEVKDELVQKYGLETTYDRESKTYQAHRILVHRLGGSIDGVSSNLVESVFAATESYRAYVPATPVASTFGYADILREPPPTADRVSLSHQLETAEGNARQAHQRFQRLNTEREGLARRIAEQSSAVGGADLAVSGQALQKLAELGRKLQAVDAEARSASAEAEEAGRKVARIRSQLGS